MKNCTIIALTTIAILVSTHAEGDFYEFGNRTDGDELLYRASYSIRTDGKEGLLYYKPKPHQLNCVVTYVKLGSDQKFSSSAIIVLGGIGQNHVAVRYTRNSKRREAKATFTVFGRSNTPGCKCAIL